MRHCPRCGTDYRDEGVPYKGIVWFCGRCGWWQVHRRALREGGDPKLTPTRDERDQP